MLVNSTKTIVHYQLHVISFKGYRMQIPLLDIDEYLTRCNLQTLLIFADSVSIDGKECIYFHYYAITVHCN